MNLRHKNPLLIATVLTVAALVCLAVGAQLLVAAGDHTEDWIAGSDGGKFIGTLTLIGGAVVFLLSTIAILAARRYAVSAAEEPEDWSGQLEISNVHEWARDLTELRDDLRREGIVPQQELVPEQLEIQQIKIEVPSSWRAKGDYLVDDTGAPMDALADLKHTRDQLIDAATRVDDIVQSINSTTSTPEPRPSLGASVRRWWRW